MDLGSEFKELNDLIASINLPKRGDEEWNQSYASSSGGATISNVTRSGYAQVSRLVKSYCDLFDDRGFQLSSLVTATAIVLYRYTGQETVAILYQVANSDGRDEEATYRIGKVKFDKTTTFDEVTAQLNQETNNISFFTKSDVKNGGYFAGTDLFRFGVTREEKKDECCNHEIWLSLIPGSVHDLGLRLQLEFKTGLYIETQMERLLTHVANILENGTSSPDKPVETLPILCNGELKAVTVDFNELNPPDPAVLEDNRSLLDVFCENAHKRGDNLAFVQDTGDKVLSLSYVELHANALALSLMLNQREVKLGIRSTFIATFLPQGLPFISTSLAVLILNKTAAMIHPTYPSKQLESCLVTLRNPLLVTTRKMMERIKHFYPRTIFIDDPDYIDPKYVPDPTDGEAAFGIDIDIDEEKPSVKNEDKRNRNPICLFTSGSTGNPKAVMITELALLNSAKFCARTYGFDASHRAMCIASTGFVIAAYDAWFMFCVGGSIHVPPEHVRMDLQALIPWIYDHEITNIFASTAIADAILHASPPGDINLSKLKWILFGGEKMHTINTRGRSFQCSHLYGSTEALLPTACVIPRDTDCAQLPTGHSLTNAAVYVLDAHYNPVPIGVKGYVYVSGAGLMSGYVNRKPEDIFLPNPFKPGTFMYPMGDIGYWTSHGELFVVGRNDAQVKVHGMRLDLGEVEAALQSYPTVQQAIVVLREVGAAKQVIAYCRLRKDADKPELLQVYQFLETRLQRHSIPCQINFVENFPMTASGKIERKAL